MLELTRQNDKNGIECRPVCDADMPFLRRVYAATREEEMQRTGWPNGAIHQFLEMQFALQHYHYVSHFEDASFYKVIFRQRGAGRLYVHRGGREIHIVDLALLHKFRNRGIGTKLMRAVMTEAEGTGLPVTLHVENTSPARRFYCRLGFEPVARGDTHALMRWTPAGALIATSHHRKEE
jgi:ribosomal protein S18 acetylase RimI-like enzyme